MEHVPDDKWFEDIELKMAIGTSNRDGCIISHNLGANHGHSLTLGWVHFTWHDRGTWFVLWEG